MQRGTYGVGATLLWMIVNSVLAPTEVTAASGQEIYQKRCQSCHGPDGKGNPKLAEMLKLKAETLDLTTPAVLGKPEAELLKAIADGKGKMPPFGKTLGEQDQRAVLTYIRQLAKGSR